MLNKLFNILSYVLILIIFFIIVEVLSILIYPDLKNKFFSESKNENFIEGFSQGIKYYIVYDKKVELYIRTSVHPNKYNNTDKPENISVYLLGDSVAGGYGVPYEQTFQRISERVLNSSSKNNYYFYTISENGSMINKITQWVNENKSLVDKNDIIIYEFNYNDVRPESLNIKSYKKDTNFIEALRNSSRELRKKYLNYSTFARVMQHYAGILSRKTSGSCTYRSHDALGQYTFAYGAKGFEKESRLVWETFEDEIVKIKDNLKYKNRFFVSLSPISLQVLNHEKNNKYNLDIDCSTFDPREKLIDILDKHNINYIDPLIRFNNFMSKFEVSENNVRLFHNYDTNHPNNLGHMLIAEEKISKILNLDD